MTDDQLLMWVLIAGAVAITIILFLGCLFLKNKFPFKVLCVIALCMEFAFAGFAVVLRLTGRA